MVFEIRPSRADKGEAVASYLEQPAFAGRLPIAIGDDLTDESMFALANARGGQSIRVGSLATATCALAKASSPSAIRSALTTIAGAGRDRKAAATS
jgi:trehalose 6-phosphate phosphatase